MKKRNIFRRAYNAIPGGILCLLVVFGLFGYLGYRRLTPKAIGAHTIGGLVAAVAAHWMFVLYSLI